ncbi:MAG: type II toxin-antitoxin system PemK/MazF family toxin [Clostridiales Family XIII bacterium]|jgi:mRNA interferase MazF|nr:type II toxin-antitoxin system PemK/MazF family toxin [Clostridiales Family XIII bacterium]
MPLKAQINNSGTHFASIGGFKERDIWWVHIGENVGFEEDGKGSDFLRPVLVMKKFNKRLFWGIPLSTTTKRGKYYYEFTASGKNKVSVALLSQFKLFDALRLVSKYAMIKKNDYEEIRDTLKDLL